MKYFTYLDISVHINLKVYCNVFFAVSECATTLFFISYIMRAKQKFSVYFHELIFISISTICTQTEIILLTLLFL